MNQRRKATSLYDSFCLFFRPATASLFPLLEMKIFQWGRIDHFSFVININNPLFYIIYVFRLVQINEKKQQKKTTHS